MIQPQSRAGSSNTVPDGVTSCRSMDYGLTAEQQVEFLQERLSLDGVQVALGVEGEIQPFKTLGHL